MSARPKLTRKMGAELRDGDEIVLNGEHHVIGVAKDYGAEFVNVIIETDAGEEFALRKDFYYHVWG